MMKFFHSLIIACLVLLTSCHKDDDFEPPTEAGKTVLVCMLGQNSLGTSGVLREDSMEMASGAVYLDKNSNNRLIVMIENAGYPNLYEVVPNKGFQLLKHYNRNLNTTSLEDFQAILDDVTELAPAQEYRLVLGSHATGWLPARKTMKKSFGIDVGENGNRGSDTKADGSYGDEMEIADLAKAIENSRMKHLKHLFFDACLMQTLEVAYELRHVTDYITASPIAISADGSNYTLLLQKNAFFSDDMTQIAKINVEDYRYRYWGTVMSVIQTDALDDLAQFTRNVLPHSTWANPDVSDVLDYGYYAKLTYYRPHYYDAAEAMKKLLGDNENLYTQWREKLDKAIIYKGFTEKFYVQTSIWDGVFRTPDAELNCGISMFIPLPVYTENTSKTEAYGDHNENFAATAWAKYILN